MDLVNKIVLEKKCIGGCIKMNKKILLPTDGSKNAERAGEYAISHAD
jgi:hypothetical protein